MTYEERELEFVKSLPQELKPHEKDARLKAWRVANPPTQSEEVVEEEEINTEPNAVLSQLTDRQADVATSALNPLEGASLGDLQTKIETNPAQAQEEYKKKIESVAKPEETYSGYDGDLEYKYNLNQGSNPTYYQRKKGTEDEWTIVDPESQKADWFDIGAKVFKHFDYDEKAANKAQKTLDSSNVFTQRYKGLLKQGSQVNVDEFVPEDIEDYEGLKKIYDENISVNDDQQNAINVKTDSFIQNYRAGKMDFDLDEVFRETEVETTNLAGLERNIVSEEDIVPILENKFEGTGIKIEEAHIGDDYVRVTLPNGDTEKFKLNYTISSGRVIPDQRKELKSYLDNAYKTVYNGYKNKAIAEVAQEQGLKPDQLDLNENAKAIEDKVLSIRNNELKSEQRVENLENYIEDLGTDFSAADYALGLVENLGPLAWTVTGILEATNEDYDRRDITDVFQKSETQKRLEQFEEIKKSNLDDRSKKIELFLAGGSDLLKDLNRQAVLISKGNYQTPRQVEEANKRLAEIKQQTQDVSDLLEKEYDKFTEYVEKNPDNAAFLDKLGRNYGTVPIIVNNIKASTVDMGLGIAELGYQAFDLYDSFVDEFDDVIENVTGVDDLGKGAVAIANPLYGTFLAFAEVMPEFEGEDGKKINFKDKVFEIANGYTEDLRGDIAEAKSVGDISDVGDFSTWFATTTGSLIPQVTAMVVAPYTGLAIVTASAGGSKFMEYQGKMEASEAEYLQALGLSEGATEEEIKKARDKYIADGGDPNALPEPVNYSTLEMWGGAMLNMGLEATTGRFISLPLAKGKSILGPLFKRTAAIGNPATRNTFNQVFANNLKKGAIHIGDATLEGAEEGFIGIGDKWYQRNVLGEDVNIMEGFYDNFSAGFVGGGYFKAPGIISSYLTPVQTPGDVSNITGLQNEIKSINNSIIENPKMSAKTRDILQNNVADKTAQINNSINNSLNIYTEISEDDFNTLGSIDQQLTTLTKQINAVAADPGITTGKEQLIEDLTNARNELTGQKNELIEGYVKTDAEGKVTGGRIVAPIIKAGSQVVADQLGVGIQTFDNTQDFIGSMETLKSEGVEVDLAQDADGNILPAEEQGYGLIATLPDGTKQVIINEASQQADGVIPADKHEVLHAFAAKMDPEVKFKMGKDLYNVITNDRGNITSRIEIDPRTKTLLLNYRKQFNEGKISQDLFYEEVMAVVSDGLTQGTVKVKETGPIMNLVNKFLEATGFKQSFEDGKQVIDFLKDFNRDVLGGQGLSQQTLDKAGISEVKGVESDTQVKESEKPEVSLTPYMGVGNRFKQGDTEDGETPAETRKKSEKNFKEFQKSAYNRDSEAVLENQDAVGPLDGIVALDKQLADLVIKSGEQSVYSWYWQNDGKNNHQEIYEEIENRKEKVQELETQYSANELRAQLKDAKGKNREDIKLAIQEKFKKLPAAVRDSEIDIYTGKPLKPVKRSEKVKEPLDAINDLIPSNIKTKDQFDKFIGDNRSALKIAQALDPGGVIHNYIRSRETSREQGDKMLDEVRLRMFNFDPAAVRADGTVVGPQGFGESIFANTRFAKLVANKDLAKEGETRKSTKSIDSEGFVEPTTSQEKSKKDTKPKQKRKSQLPRETTKFTTNFASNLNIDTKGKSDKQIQEEVQKQFDEAIAKDLEAMPVKTFGETRNIGPAVAALMEKATGMPAKVFTDKSQNIQKKDADSGALTAVKQYLYNNAQRDFNNLPDAFDTATGKANFIPENIKREFYKKDSKGKFILDKSKGLKDYQDLLGDMDKPVYRASEAQTIKGLINLSLRNRIFEQAVPDPVARKTTGVKFSVKPNDVDKVLGVDNTDVLEGINIALKALDGGKFDNLPPKDKIKKYNELFEKLIEAGFPINDLLSSRNLYAAGGRYNKINARQKNTGMHYVSDVNAIKKMIASRQETIDLINKAKIPKSAEGQISYGKKAYVKEYLEKDIAELNKTLDAIKKDRVGEIQKLKDKFPRLIYDLIHGKGAYNKLPRKKQWDKDLKDPNIEKALKPNPTSKNEKVVNKTIKDNIADINEIKEGIKSLLDIVYNLDKELQAPFLRMFHGDSNFNNNAGRQIGAVLGDMGIFPKDSKGNPLTITNEHVLQFGAYTRIIGLALNLPKTAADANGGPNFDTIRDWLSNNIFQVALADIKGKNNQEGVKGTKPYPEGFEGVFDPTESKEFWNAKSQLEPFLRDTIKDYINGKITAKDLNKVSSLTRYFNEYFYRNPNNVRVYNPKTKKLESVAEMTGAVITKNVVIKDKTYTPKELMKVDKEGIAEFPNVEKYQAFAAMKQLRGEWTKAKVRKFLDLTTPIAVEKHNAGLRMNRIASEIVGEGKTSQEIKEILENSFETKVKVMQSVRVPKVKGISVFDFDDTLAKTKEKVIVINQDGSIKEISASQFAKDAAKLTEQGAEFDFKNFENVSLDTAEGPLADLARKRQGKFGSKDIFVLTARPQVAAESIKQFLDAIGINIPLENITGLEDGTAQAKVDWILNKTAEGYNDFYFADDSFANVAGVKAVLDAVDVKNKVHQAKVKKSEKLDKELNQILEEVTGIGKFKRYSNVRARLEGMKKDGGLTKRVAKQFTITPSADDFIGLTYAFRGKGEQGNKHTKWIEDNLIKPYNKAELELMSAKITVADDFAALRKQFPSLKTTRNKVGVLQNPLHAPIGIGPYTKSQAIRVYMWNKQGMEIPGMSKRDINDLVKAVESDMELQVFADEVIQIQKGKSYPAPGKNWLAGDIKSDILNGLDKGFRKKLMTEFSENADIIFSPENLNKLEALFGSKYREALVDSLRRMKTGSNRPQYDGPGSRIVNDMLDWLNASVGVTMFLNRKSGLLQMLSTVNFINWGDNNLYAASKAFASKDFYPTFMRLMNSPYLVNRRDGLKINVNEAELVDRGRKDGFQGLVSYLLDKGFIFTRIADSLAIATGGATFFINRKKALLNRVNPETGKKYTEAEADAKAFDDFYAIAEETQQSSNPSRISQQQASMAGRVFLSFQNVTMQFNRKTKKSILDFVKRRKRPGMTQRESDMSNLSNVVYYVGMQNLIFHSLQQALFAGMFGEDEEEEKDKNKTFDTANSMVDSLLFGLGFGGAIVSTVKNVAMKIYNESQKKSPDYEDPLWDLFDVSPVIDSKVRKLRQAAKSFSWNMKEIKRRGWSLDNPAYLAVSQIVSSFFNVPMDNLMNMMNAGSNIMDNEVRMWQKIALSLGWSPYILGLPYWGRQSTIDREAKEDEQLKIDYAKAVKNVKAKGFTKKIPLSGPNHYIPKGKLGVDYMQVERIDGTIQYYVKHTK